MTPANSAAPTPRKPLRLWPGVAAIAVQWIGGYLVPVLIDDAAMIGLACVALGTLAFLVWWLFASRAAWVERLAGVGLIIAGLLVTPAILHESVRTAGMGIAFYILAIPVFCLAFVAWAVVFRRSSPRARLVTMAATMLLACAGWSLVRTDGITGDGSQLWAWRWSETAEQRLLARSEDEPVGPVAAPTTTEASELAVEAAPEPTTPPPAEEPTAPHAAAEDLAEAPDRLSLDEEPAAVVADWPGFRGPARDGVVPGARIATAWSESPPVELWRRPIGPGWSSFAVQGGRLYTQEQRGEEELVSCYDAATGEPIWRHRDPARFWESHAGAGPRATPTLVSGRLYTFGATGILNALDAADGSLIWSRDAAADTGKEVPHWGFTSSPLVVGGLVIVDTGTLVAYDLATGEVRWTGPESSVSYSSPHLVTLEGVTQVLLLGGSGAVSVAPADGSTLWEHIWPGSSIVQPNRTADGDLLLSATGAASGRAMRRLAVSRKADGWAAEVVWTSNGLKPYFSDFVVHRGHAFGFDGRIMASLDLEDGKRSWKGGRYGHGQLLLLPDQDLLLVVSEKGELALVSATTDRFTELARVPGLEGKSWTHPVLVGDLLVLRNSEEMVAFRLSAV